jgi:hypothetical protein
MATCKKWSHGLLLFLFSNYLGGGLGNQSRLERRVLFTLLLL